MRLVIPVCVAVCVVALGGRDGHAQSAVAAPPLTEAEAIARLMASDPRLSALRARTDEERAVQAERTSWPNPVASFSRERVSRSDDIFVVARQEVPVTDRRGRLQAAGRLAVEAVDAEVRFQTGELQADLRQAFTTLLAIQEQESVLEHAARDLRQLIEILRAREEAGEGARYDRLRGERAFIDLEADRSAAAVARTRAQADLAAFLGPGIASEALVAAGSLEPATPARPVAELTDAALSARADYRARTLTLEQFEAERRAAQALRVPTPTLGYGLKRTTVGNLANNGYQFSVDVALPILNRGQAAVARVDAQAARAEAEAAFLRLRIETEVRASHATLTQHRERVARYRRSLTDTAEPLAAIARVAYEEGEMGILELLDATRQLFEARLRVLEMHTAARRAAIEMDRAMGLEIRP